MRDSQYLLGVMVSPSLVWQLSHHAADVSERPPQKPSVLHSQIIAQAPAILAMSPSRRRQFCALHDTFARDM